MNTFDLTEYETGTSLQEQVEEASDILKNRVRKSLRHSLEPLAFGIITIDEDPAIILYDKDKNAYSMNPMTGLIEA